MKRNRTALAPTMVQTQEETKEKIERNLPFEETKEDIHVPGEQINLEITKERKEEIHLLLEDTKEETFEERKKKFIFLRQK